MNPGKLRHRITIEQPTTALNEFGENIQSWTDFACLWADVRSENGSERTTPSKLQAEISHSILIRYITGIAPNMRINWNSRILEIIAVLPDRTDAKFIIIKCRENINGS